MFMTVELKDNTRSRRSRGVLPARKKLGDEAPGLPTGVIGPFVNDEYSDVTFAV